MKYFVPIIIGAVILGVGITLIVTNNTDEQTAKPELQNKIEQIIKSDSKLEDVGVYFYDFSNKKELSINGSTEFQPASLYKVPVMMAYFKLAEIKPEVTEQQFMRVTTLDENAGQFYKPKDFMPLNIPKTSDETIEYMIRYSDNIATNILYSFVGAENIKNTFAFFNLEINTDIQGQSISAEQYSRFFKALYDKTYLDPFLSDLALEFLKRVEFDKGITQGVPTGTVVAHKFGTPNKVGNSYQLHDCGIVYAPNEPYFLCVMSKGKDRTSLEQVVGSISKAVYEEVTKN